MDTFLIGTLLKTAKEKGFLTGSSRIKGINPVDVDYVVKKNRCINGYT